MDGRRLTVTSLSWGQGAGTGVWVPRVSGSLGMHEQGPTKKELSRGKERNASGFWFPFQYFLSGGQTQTRSRLKDGLSSRLSESLPGLPMEGCLTLEGNRRGESSLPFFPLLALALALPRGALPLLEG